MIRMRCWAAALCLVSVACGRSPFGIGGVAGGSGDGGAEDGADDDPGGEEADDGRDDDDDDGPDDDDDDDASDTGEDACAGGPDVRNAWVYDGESLETVGEDILRHGDVLYMSGSAADGESTFLWLAAAQTDGTLLWEERLHPRLGTNLSGWRPVASRLAVAGDVLVYAGNTYDQIPIGLMGTILPIDDVVFPGPEVSGAMYYGVASIDGPVDLLLAGRDYGPVSEGARFERFGGGDWIRNTVEAGSFHDIVAAVAILDDDSAIVAGRSNDLPWIARIDLDDGDLRWSASVGQATFEVDTGAFWSVQLDDERAYVSGFVYQTKPKPDRDGSWSFGEVFVAAYDLEGGLEWTWQRSSTTARPGDANALTLGADGTVFVAGEESEFSDDAALFVSAFSPEGEVLWQLDDLGHGDVTGLLPVGITPGDDGQLFVLTNTYHPDGLRRTTLVELCY